MAKTVPKLFLSSHELDSIIYSGIENTYICNSCIFVARMISNFVCRMIIIDWGRYELVIILNSRQLRGFLQSSGSLSFIAQSLARASALSQNDLSSSSVKHQSSKHPATYSFSILSIPKSSAHCFMDHEYAIMKHRWFLTIFCLAMQSLSGRSTLSYPHLDQTRNHPHS